ncbi:MAG: ActS/PrrB/RegB family redox-sensitive histidine kinase [Rhodobacteraceae bacterium]|nr:ActS/PrrB/RegB family redox-sensitive histidine kinase [Paracoccaceae bacterium]
MADLTAADQIPEREAEAVQTDQKQLVTRSDTRANWIRLRTLVYLRWVAIAGQLVALNVAQRIYDLQLEMALCYLAIGISVVANLMAIWLYPENKRLSETETFFFLLFDLMQLGFLLALTGGLNNPFSLLVLAPVTISATVLPTAPTMLLGAVALAVVSFTGLFHVPLRTSDGFVLQNSYLFALGFWAAIVVGCTFIAIYARRVTEEMHAMSRALLATQMALAREQKLTDLGGVVAAAAHELGTPLATIKLVSGELMDELPEGDLREDAVLIRSQADRCRDILRSMGRAGKDDLHLRYAPFETVVREAAEPHMNRGKEITIHFAPGEDGSKGQPQIRRHPEVIHGLRNLVQNAVDFAKTEVCIELSWNGRNISVEIADDGRGFSAAVIGRLGDPFMRSRRRSTSGQRPGYEGMGLGLFIAKTLLERTGADIRFANGPMGGRLSGARVSVIWPHGKITGGDGEKPSPMGQNERIT